MEFWTLEETNLQGVAARGDYHLQGRHEDYDHSPSGCADLRIAVDAGFALNTEREDLLILLRWGTGKRMMGAISG